MFLKKFKFRFEQSIKNAKCDYARYTNPDQRKLFNACRYLVRFWTYLDIVKDCKTQRFFPNSDTIKRAAKIFGYEDGENPFVMNGKYRKSAERTKEEKPMEETKTTKYNLNLDTSIDEFNFTTRTRNGLWRAGHRTLGDIVNLDYKALMKIRNLGLHSAKEVLEKLNEIRSASESAIDIAEQAAKEVKEESKVDILTEVGVDQKLSNECHMKLVEDYSKLEKKYNDLLDVIHENGVKIDELVGEKRALENYNARLKEDIVKLNEELSALSAKTSRSDNDILAIISKAIERMKIAGIRNLKTGINGYSIDIEQKYMIASRG